MPELPRIYKDEDGYFCYHLHIGSNMVAQWVRNMSLTWMLLVLMMVLSTEQSTTPEPVTTDNEVTETERKNGTISREKEVKDVKSILLTPREQMNVDMEAEAQQTEELEVEKQLRVIDLLASSNGTAVSQHSQFTFTALESVLTGRKHRICVIRIFIAVRLKLVANIFLPQLFPFGFGCKVNCPDECPCDINSPYRTADGHCNNLVHSRWGMAKIPMRRWLYPDYDDVIASPRQLATLGGFLPSARLVSTTVHLPSDETDRHEMFTHMLMQWGQFLDHDITSTPTQQIPQGGYLSSVTCCRRLIFSNGGITQAQLNARPQCFPIHIPSGDRHFMNDCMNFVRSVQVPNANCQAAPVEQMNQITAYIDASQVYGSSQQEQNELRTFTDGKLKDLDNHLPEDTQEPPSCPLESPADYCFLAGDHRVNENPTLQSLHTILMRMHNIVAWRLKELNCHWGDERLFQEARKIIGAGMQVITYGEYLPIVLGPTQMAIYGLNLGSGSSYTNMYSETTDASVRNAFATAAFRMGHSMIRSFLSSFDPVYTDLGSDQLSTVFGTTHPILSIVNRQVGHYARGLTRDCVQNVDCKLTTEVTDHLFEDFMGDSFDLAALNIQRGRDHGLPSYTKWRNFCQLPSVSSFGALVLSSTHTEENADKLRNVYEHVNDIDLFSGGLTETPVPGGLVGPTFACLLGRQFQALKKGDRFWFEEGNDNVKFTPDQLEQLRKITLSLAICSSTDTTAIQKNAFNKTDPWTQCEDLDQVDLTPWKENLGEWTEWSGWGPCKEGLETRTRTCKPCCGCDGPNVDARPCNSDPCGWSPWSYWSECKVDRKYRTRQCRCPGCNTEIHHCY